ncbi:MAG: ABC transporter ATP-binding protein [Deltaproteobacteria bacterium]|nr:ABC transporter ATP-binding protein [Deltaproteobacteria bacterium]MBW1961556.1 ABC transporter ATP-binding protein [Deltaproteobacteria bacterium]MBW1995306.1 ABC transporter ATP-binding protein [Deltaproteobacteria bacterium]MBW2152345.1 ABC transporter ATP-binding protein [Deltaproteobacteria bacterium]
MNIEDNFAKASILRVKDLRVHFFTPRGTARAVDGVGFHLDGAETIGIVGESGCGKSVTALSILRLIPQPSGKIVGGTIYWKDEDLLQCPENRMESIRGKQISMIFQEPMTSLNPVLTIGYQLSEMFHVRMGTGKREARQKAIEMLKMVHIPAPENKINAYPHELSGGMRQRVMIAMALSCRPELLIADEPTTALDVTIQAQVLELMKQLQAKLGMAMILITHDLGIVAHTVERVLIMYAGKIIEEGNIYTIFDNPSHPYTEGLLKAVPRIKHGSGSETRRLYEIKGVVPSLYRVPDGCRFYPRCHHRKEHCRWETPVRLEVEPGHFVSCWR